MVDFLKNRAVNQSVDEGLMHDCFLDFQLTKLLLIFITYAPIEQQSSQLLPQSASVDPVIFCGLFPRVNCRF